MAAAVTGPPPAGECHLWWGRAGVGTPKLAAMMDADERARLDGYLRRDDRDRFAVGAAILRLCCARYLDRPPREIVIDRACARCGRPHGKPRVAGDGAGTLELSVAHSGQLVVVAATAGAPVGVDVERLRSDLDAAAIGRSALSRGEAAAVQALAPADRPRALLVLWTRKEAVLKAVGTGLAVEPATVVVSGPGAPAGLVAWPPGLGPARAVSLHDQRPDADYVASVAILSERARIVSLDASCLLAGAGEPAGEPWPRDAREPDRTAGAS